MALNSEHCPAITAVSSIFHHFTLKQSFFFFSLNFIYLLERKAEADMEIQAPCREPDAGHDQRDHDLSPRQMLNDWAVQAPSAPVFIKVINSGWLGWTEFVKVFLQNLHSNSEKPGFHHPFIYLIVEQEWIVILSFPGKSSLSCNAVHPGGSLCPQSSGAHFQRSLRGPRPQSFNEVLSRLCNTWRFFYYNIDHFLVSSKIHSCALKFSRSWQMYQGVYPPSQDPTEQLLQPKISLCFTYSFPSRWVLGTTAASTVCVALPFADSHLIGIRQ